LYAPDMSNRFIALVTAAVTTALMASPAWTQTQSGFHSAAQGVELVAQLSGTAQVGWSVEAVPQPMLELGQTADVVVLQESFTLGRGQTLDAKCQVIAGPQAGAAFFHSQPQNMVSSFLDTGASAANNHEQTFPLVINFDPSHGSATDYQSIVIFGKGSGSAPSATVRITVVAL
jgi:hypothetical protein